MLSPPYATYAAMEHNAELNHMHHSPGGGDDACSPA